MSAASRLEAAWLVHGPLAWALLPLSWLYRLLFALRGAAYRSGLKKSVQLPVPVIVVGNLIVGGAGKTPTTMAVVALLRSRGYQPGIISRGYGRTSDDVVGVESDTSIQRSGDEPLLMRIRTKAPVVVGADRVAAATELLKHHPEVNVIVSDDGLQHLRLKRDAQVIVFDERGVGNGWLLPAGPLREPISAQVPKRSVVLYNAPRPSTGWAGHLAQRRLAGVTPLADWWAGVSASKAHFAALAQRPVLAAAGVARPQRFFDMLRAEGLSLSELPLPDHFDFTHMPWPADTDDVIVTEKDAVKLRPESVGTARIWVATLDFELGPAFEAELMQCLSLPQ